jgi:hypothetical protein
MKYKRIYIKGTFQSLGMKRNIFITFLLHFAIQDRGTHTSSFCNSSLLSTPLFSSFPPSFLSSTASVLVSLLGVSSFCADSSFCSTTSFVFKRQRIFVYKGYIICLVKKTLCNEKVLLS